LKEDDETETKKETETEVQTMAKTPLMIRRIQRGRQKMLTPKKKLKKRKGRTTMGKRSL
jgi:hypothetical protein